MRIAILGLGLIGGSIARALRDRPDAMGPGRLGTVVAWTATGEGPAAALAADVIDEVAGSVGEAVDGAELVILAAPPVACLGLLEEVARRRASLAPDAVVTDVGSTKVAIDRLADRLGVPFVGGHPMAGREATGFHASSVDLFRGRPWVVVESSASPAGGPDRVAALAAACGARPVRMSASEHDQVVAGISHLPLVLATALVEAVVGPPGAPDRDDWAVARELASTGWTGMTRLALGSPEMAADIAATNAVPLATRLRDLRVRIDEWIALLDDEADAADLQARFHAARDRLAGPDGGPR